MHFDKKMPLQTIELQAMGQKQQFYELQNGSYLPVMQVGENYEKAKASNLPSYIENRTEIFNTQVRVKTGDAYKDLYKITLDFFQQPKYGLFYTILYVISMAVLAFHLSHGLASSFQSIGMSHPKYSPFIDKFGLFFSIVVSALFAWIPVYIHFVL